MARAYTQDLRDGVIDVALSGLPARQAAARFGVGIGTAIDWVRRARERGVRAARRQGQPRRSELDAHRELLLSPIAESSDSTIAEMQARLRDEYGVSPGRSGAFSTAVV